MNTYRTIFVAMPPLLSEIVKDVLCDQLDLDLVAHFDRPDTLTEQLPVLAPDLVVIGLRAGEDDTIARVVLRTVPTAKVIAISSDCHHAYLHEMRAHRTVLNHFSLASLLSAIAGPLLYSHN